MKIDITGVSISDLEKVIDIFGAKNVYLCKINGKSYLVEHIELEHEQEISHFANTSIKRI